MSSHVVTYSCGFGIIQKSILDSYGRTYCDLSSGGEGKIKNSLSELCALEKREITYTEQAAGRHFPNRQGI